MTDITNSQDAFVSLLHKAVYFRLHEEGLHAYWQQKELSMSKDQYRNTLFDEVALNLIAKTTEYANIANINLRSYTTIQDKLHAIAPKSNDVERLVNLMNQYINSQQYVEDSPEHYDILVASDIGQILVGLCSEGILHTE
jgi:Holliday junction resolvase-like predicted endonuclease